MPSIEREAMGSALKQWELHEYDVEQCVPALMMERSAAENHLIQIGMKRGHIRRFLLHIWSGRGSKRSIDSFCQRGNDSIRSPSFEEVLAIVLKSVSQFTSKNEVTPTLPLMDLGIDSLDAAQLAELLEQQTNVQLSPLLIFEYSTAYAVAAHIRASLSTDQVSAPRVTVTPSWHDLEPSGSVGSLDLALPACSARLANIASLADLWSALALHQASFERTPTTRWALESDWAASAMYGTFMSGIMRFDARRFSISPMEAQYMEPSQRVVLEVGYEALCTGRGKAALSGSRIVVTGVALAYFPGFEFASVVSSYHPPTP